MAAGGEVTEQPVAGHPEDALRRQRERSRKHRSLRALAGGVAHELNNSLAVALNLSNLLLPHLTGDAEGQAIVDDLKASVDRMARFCGRLMECAGRGQARLATVNLSDEVDSLRSALRSGLPAVASIRYDLARDLPRVQADPVQLRRVVLDLARNAATRLEAGGGAISIRTGSTPLTDAERSNLYLESISDAEAYAYVEISDDAASLPSDRLEGLFDPFGSGFAAGDSLDMAVALGIVTRNGGAISVRSGPSGGNRIRALFPAAPAAQGPPPPAARGPGLTPEARA